MEGQTSCQRSPKPPGSSRPWRIWLSAPPGLLALARREVLSGYGEAPPLCLGGVWKVLLEDKLLKVNMCVSSRVLEAQLQRGRSSERPQLLHICKQQRTNATAECNYLDEAACCRGLQALCLHQQSEGKPGLQNQPEAWRPLRNRPGNPNQHGRCRGQRSARLNWLKIHHSGPTFGWINAASTSTRMCMCAHWMGEAWMEACVSPGGPCPLTGCLSSAH